MLEKSSSNCTNKFLLHKQICDSFTQACQSLIVPYHKFISCYSTSFLGKNPVKWLTFCDIYTGIVVLLLSVLQQHRKRWTVARKFIWTKLQMNVNSENRTHTHTHTHIHTHTHTHTQNTHMHSTHTHKQTNTHTHTHTQQRKGQHVIGGSLSTDFLSKKMKRLLPLFKQLYACKVKPSFMFPVLSIICYKMIHVL